MENLLFCILKLGFCGCFAPLGHALIRYNNLGSALYAKEKLNGFEYPPGNRLIVNFVDDGEDRSRYQTYTTRRSGEEMSDYTECGLKQL